MHKTSSAVQRALRATARRATTQAASPVQITTLPNGLRVATENTPGHFAALGLYVDAGSRYETAATSGVSHFIDRMAFKSTADQTAEEVSASIDALGGQIMASSSRESLMYQSCHTAAGTPRAMQLIADTVLRPALTPAELDVQRDAARYEIRELGAKPEMILPEVLHDVAYGGKTLGNPLLCPEHRVDAVDESTVRAFMHDLYRPERMVVAGAGMQHQELVELTDKYFSSLKPEAAHAADLQTLPGSSRAAQSTTPTHLLSPSSPSILKSLTRAASFLSPNSSIDPAPMQSTNSYTGKAVYTGGHRFIQDPNSEFNHLYLGFEGVHIHDKDIYALATIQIMLGGGGSFSAGGPGKGMYSRLYTHVLNHYPQIDHCASFNHIYADSALFGLFATFFPAGVPGAVQRGNTPAQILPLLAHQLSLLVYSPVPAQELARARNQLKSSLVMALESRAVEVEDLGRQLLTYSRRVPVAEMCDRIDEVDTDAIRRVATRLFGPNSGNKPSIVAMGQEDVGDYKAVLRKYAVASG